MHTSFEKAFQRTAEAFVIAEIGHNHQGALDTARQLFKAASDAGADAVKLQKRSNRSLYVKSLYNQPYDNENSYGATYGQHREALEFGQEEYRVLQRDAQDLGLLFFATAFDHESVDFLEALDMPAYKLASGDLTNTPLQRYVASTGKPVFMSTGGGTIDDIRRAADAILPINPRLTILHCTASYPADIAEMNLNVIPVLLSTFPDQVIGFSDHENGIDAASLAYMLGARVFEKHFTLNRAFKGTDHSFSLEPMGLKKLVRNLRRIPLMLGDGEKRMFESEKKPLAKMSKSLVAARAMPAGRRLDAEDICLKSPGGGLPPYELERVVGQTLRKAVAEDEQLAFEHFA